MRNEVLLIGGKLCDRVGAGLDRAQWEMLGMRRSRATSVGVRWLSADLTVPASLRALPDGITHVLYAPAPDRRTPESYGNVYSVGLGNLLDALAERSCLRRFVLVTSTAVWAPSEGARGSAWVDETTPAQPDNFRGAALLRAEEQLQQRLPGVGVALRLGGIYGPGRTRLIDGLRHGSLVAPAGPGHWSNRIHIDDAASACIHLLQLREIQSCYIGTDGDPTDTALFYERLAQLLHAPALRRQFMPPTGKRLSNARLVDSGWAPRWPDALEGYRALLSD